MATSRSVMVLLEEMRHWCIRTIGKHSQWLCYALKAAVVILLCVYVGISVSFSLQGSVPLLVAAGAGGMYVVGIFGKCLYRKHLAKQWQKLVARLEKFRKRGRRLVYVGLAVAVVVFLVVDVGMTNPKNLMSLCGIAFYILASLIASKAPHKIDWGTVFTGMLAQLVMGLVVLRWDLGRSAIEWISNKLIDFLKYGDYGSEFLFGQGFREHGFFMLSPSILWFAGITQLLLYFGILPVIASVLGEVLYFCVGTSPVEAFVAITNIFLGSAAAAIMVQSMLPDLTLSQIHAFMVCGLASITASLFPVFQTFGVPARHLLSASCMSAPAGLVLSKIIYPETETLKDTRLKLTKPVGSNFLGMFYRGALSSLEIIANIIAVLVAFVSILSFINSTVSWFGDRAGIHELTMEKMLGYILMPVVFLMGVVWEDCALVGQLIGTKTIINEFVAYTDLAVLIENRKQGIDPSISERSETISAYALCGFSNFGAIGMQVAMFCSMIPDKRGEISEMALRSLLAGSFACFMTACVAGLLAT